ncbi:MAG: hypothetical protein QOF60_1 [Actinomycetota bacterium]|jgi:hypothetical protein|nr:hypothetical protein [Actinomycetota bacterium]
MKRRLAVLLTAALVGALALIIPTASPASAATTGVCAGVGFASTPPLTYPITPGSAPGFAAANSGAFNFSLDNGACVPGAGTLTASGNLAGYCGLSGGTGVTNTGNSFGYIGIGSILLITGQVVGVVNATPDVVFTGQSCTTGATRFIVTGVAVGIDAALPCASLVVGNLPTLVSLNVKLAPPC